MTESQAAGVIAALGLAVGSFLNVCIYRLPRDESVIKPPSRCPSCERRLSWFENVPLFSYLLLGGRCRTCRVALSRVYPIVEILTMVVFVLQYWLVGWQPLLLVRLVFAASMIVLFVIDLQYLKLPNVITLPGVLIGVVASVFLEPGWRSSLVGLATGGGALWTIRKTYWLFCGREGMGLGDIAMLSMVGAFLGWRFTLITLLIASVTGSVFGGGLILFNRSNMRKALPFLGPFLTLDVLMVGIFLGWQFTLLVPLLAGPLTSVGMVLTAGPAFLVGLIGLSIVGFLTTGFFLDWQPTLLFALFTVPLIGLGMFLPSRDGLKFEVPFGSFLAASAVVTTFVGRPLFDWYLGFWMV